MSEEEEILKQTVMEEDVPEQTSLSEKVQEDQKQYTQKRNRRIIIIGCLSFVAFVAWFLFKPFKATAEYGVCRTFLELNVPYPHTIYVSEIKQQRDGSLRLWYTHTDAFGGYRIESFQCKLTNDPETGATKVASLKMSKVFLDDKTVQGFNNAIPYFIENPRMLTWPQPLPDSLSDLHFDFNAVRSIILDVTKR